MKVNLAESIKNYDGKPLMNEAGVRVELENDYVGYLPYGTKVKGPDGKEVELVNTSKETTVADIFINACATSIKGVDDESTGENKLALFRLAESFHKNKEKTLDVDLKDIVMIQERINKLYINPAVYASVDRVINPDKK